MVFLFARIRNPQTTESGLVVFGFACVNFDLSSLGLKFLGLLTNMVTFVLQIRDSNRAMLLAAAVQQQCKFVDLGIASDDEETIERVLDSAFSSGIDILLTSGGVSMGDRDFVKPLLHKRGKVYFDKVK